MAHLITLEEEKFEFTSKLRNFTFMLIAVGLVLSVIGVFTTSDSSGHHDQATESHATATTDHDGSHGEATASDAEHEDAHAGDHNTAGGHGEEGHGSSVMKRFWASLLFNSYYFLLFSIIGTFFVALNYIANAGWPTAIKRIPEAMGAYLPVALVSILVVIFFGKNQLYHWAHYEHLHITDPNDPQYDAILAGKSGFLNSPFLIVGTIVIIGIWILFTRSLRKASLQEDLEGGLTFFNVSIRRSAAFTFIFAFSFSILSWLLIMSVDAHWFSTIFSVYNFAIAFVSGLAIITLLVVFLKSQGYMSYVTDEHLHDLGKFMFGFSIFWTYIWVSQFLLIWYANLPEESAYYAARYEGIFKTSFLVNLFLNFICPFFILMTRNAKRNPKVLALVATIILIGHWNDLWLSVMPGTVGEAAGIGFMEIGMAIFFLGLFLLIVFNALSKASLYPKQHPYLQESLQYDTGP